MVYMEFRSWLMEKFKEWEKTQPNGRSNYSSFARYLGVGVNNYAQWRSGNNLPSFDKTKLLAQKLGNEIYDILGYDRPQDGGSVSLDSFPPELRSALLEARDKIVTLGLVGGSPEAWAVVNEAMSKAGYIQIDTATREVALKKK